MTQEQAKQCECPCCVYCQRLGEKQCLGCRRFICFMCAESGEQPESLCSNCSFEWQTSHE